MIERQDFDNFSGIYYGDTKELILYLETGKYLFKDVPEFIWAMLKNVKDENKSDFIDSVIKDCFDFELLN